MKPKTGLQHVTRFGIMRHAIAQSIIMVMHIDNDLCFNIQFHSPTTPFTFIYLADDFTRSQLRTGTLRNKIMYNEYPEQTGKKK